MANTLIATTVNMPSRYDNMKESVTTDIDLDTFPDPLSVDYSTFTYSEPPIKMPVTQDMKDMLYRTCFGLYGAPYYDDIILNLNGISHISKIDELETIKFPILTNIKSWLAPE